MKSNNVIVINEMSINRHATVCQFCFETERNFPFYESKTCWEFIDSSPDNSDEENCGLTDPPSQVRAIIAAFESANHNPRNFYGLKRDLNKMNKILIILFGQILMINVGTFTPLSEL